ncbi:MAG: HNH endonuclease [Planctomycetes bacterium]|nr:HNH endonuclease [Planctomycetota bacterium]
MPRDADRGRCSRCLRRVRKAHNISESRAAKRRPKRSRPSPSARGYGGDWRRRRAAQLRLEPICRRCGDPADQVDHVLPKSQGGTDEQHNLQSLCTRCHSRKTVLEDGGAVFGQERAG